MSQTKAQLIQPVGIFTAPGVNVSGTLTATTFSGNLTGDASSLAGTPNVNAGVLTATSFYGDGSNLTGVAGSTFVGVVTTSQSGTTTIDLSLGNVIYFTHDTDTTVAFANTETTQVVQFIRVKDDTTTARTITWPDSIIWNGGSAPTLIDSSSAEDVQIFDLLTRDQGVTWYGYESMKNDPEEPVVIGPYSVWTFGYNNQGQLGLNEPNIQRSSPKQIPGTQWALIDGGSNTSLGTKTDGTLWIWGSNQTGQLGLNNLTYYSSPIQIPGTQWSKVIFGQTGAGGTKTDGTLWMWGDAGTGKLGLNDIAVPRSSPHQIPGTQWNNIYFTHSGGFNFGTKNDGTLWGWGYNYNAELGQNDVIYRSSPTQIPGTQWNWSGDSGINKFSSGTRNDAFGIKTDGTLWAWGEGQNNIGRLGLNDLVDRSSPTQLPGTQWNTVSAGGATLATKTDGTLWSWGYSGQGATGFSDTVPRSSPTQIPGTQWNNAEVNNYFSLATKTDGTLWAWGGSSIPFPSPWNNPNVNYSSPIQLPGTDWASLGNTLGHNHGFMMKST